VKRYVNKVHIRFWRLLQFIQSMFQKNPLTPALCEANPYHPRANSRASSNSRAMYFTYKN